MIIARQSTARTMMIGPVLDSSGTAVTDGVVGDFKISKNGAAPAALNASATLTHRHTGHYSLALTASDLDTVGQAEIVIDDTTNACGPKEITIIEEAVYDALFAASAPGYLQPTTAGRTLTVEADGMAHADVKEIEGADATNQIAASVPTPPTANAIADQVWDEATSGHQTAGSTGKALTDAGAIGNVTVGEFTAAALGQLEGLRASLSTAPLKGGKLTMVIGDDRSNAIGNAIPWSVTNATALATMVGASVVLLVTVDGVTIHSSTGVISVATGATRSGYVEFTPDDYGLIEAGEGEYQLQFTFAGGEIATLVIGQAEMIVDMVEVS